MAIMRLNSARLASPMLHTVLPAAFKSQIAQGCVTLLCCNVYIDTLLWLWVARCLLQCHSNRQSLWRAALTQS